MVPPKRVRVAAYVTRQHLGRTQLLVFRHRDHPEAGIQVPAGGVMAGETLSQALRREIREETGLQVEAGESLGVQDSPHPVTGEGRLTVFFHAPVSCEKMAWTHMVSGDDSTDEGLVFECEFVDLSQLELPFGQGEFLALVNTGPQPASEQLLKPEHWFSGFYPSHLYREPVFDPLLAGQPQKLVLSGFTFHFEALHPIVLVSEFFRYRERCGVIDKRA